MPRPTFSIWQSPNNPNGIPVPERNEWAAYQGEWNTPPGAQQSFYNSPNPPAYSPGYTGDEQPYDWMASFDNWLNNQLANLNQPEPGWDDNQWQQWMQGNDGSPTAPVEDNSDLPSPTNLFPTPPPLNNVLPPPLSPYYDYPIGPEQPYYDYPIGPEPNPAHGDTSFFDTFGKS